MANLQFTGSDDVAIRYWAGEQGRQRSRATSRPSTSGRCRTSSTRRMPTSPATPFRSTGSTSTPPVRPRGRTLRPCSGASPSPATRAAGRASCTPRAPTRRVQCRVGFSAEVDTGPNKVRGADHRPADPGDGWSGIAPVTVDFDTTGGGAGPNLATVAGTITIRPNATQDRQHVLERLHPGRPDVLQRLVAPDDGHGRQRRPARTVPAVATAAVRSRARRSRAWPATSSSRPTWPTRSARRRSSQRRSARLRPPTPRSARPGRSRSRSPHTAFDQEHIVTLRGSVQGSGNRTRAIYCGNGPGKGAAALGNGIRDGCAKRLVVNQRQDSCSPAPGASANPWDCVQLEQGNKSSIAKGAEDRFPCTPNNWVTGGPLPYDEDPRWAYIILTEFGRTFPAGNNAWLPDRGPAQGLRHRLGPAGRRRRSGQLLVQRRAAARLRHQGRAALGPPGEPDHARPERDRHRRQVQPDARRTSSASRPSSDDAAAGRKTEPTAPKN